MSQSDRVIEARFSVQLSTMFIHLLLCFESSFNLGCSSPAHRPTLQFLRDTHLFHQSLGSPTVSYACDLFGCTADEG